MSVAGFQSLFKRNYSSLDIRGEYDVAKAGFRVYITDPTTTPRGFRLVWISDSDLDNARVSNIVEACISLYCARTKPRDGGRLTQDDAIRGWL